MPFKGTHIYNFILYYAETLPINASFVFDFVEM